MIKKQQRKNDDNLKGCDKKEKKKKPMQINIFLNSLKFRGREYHFHANNKFNRHYLVYFSHENFTR